MTGAGNHFADQLAAAIDATGTCACVGIDPDLDKMPRAISPGAGRESDALWSYCRGVLQAISDLVPAVKFQAACFERLGPKGMEVLRGAVAMAREQGLVVIADAKRGDIGHTNEHYAECVFGGEAQADAVTLSGYLGMETLSPFFLPGKGAFVLVRTTNPGADVVQSAKLADGRTVAELLADLVAEAGKDRVGACGLSDIGAVVAANHPEDAAALRSRMPDQIFLVPGYGTQGGTVESIKPLVRPGASGQSGKGVLVTASRSVTYAFDPEVEGGGWVEQVRRVAKQFAEDVAGV